MENKQQLLSDQAAIEQLEERLEQRLELRRLEQAE